MNIDANCVSEQAVKPYIDKIGDMIGEQLGSNYLSTDEMQSIIRKDTNKHIVMVMPDKESDVYGRENEIPIKVYHTPINEDSDIDYDSFPDSTITEFLAVSIGFTINSVDFASQIELQGQSFPKVFQYKKKVGLIDGTAINPEFTRRGFGEKALKTNSWLLKKKGCNILCAWGWRNRKGIYAGHVFSACGFRPEREYNRYWEKESIRSGFHCPCCGPPPCTCSAILYVQ